MTGSFALSLPTDIPWRRICASEDMLDPVACDAKVPPSWHSSIAVFRYDPAEEYQPFSDLVVSYLKVAVTVAPLMPDISPGKLTHYPPEVADELQEAFPCYGALLHVSVSPDEKDMKRFGKKSYPYFSDFEPKKRELYEAVTDTGEILSGSRTAVNVRKGATNTETTENYNLDTGWNFGMQASVAGTGGGFNVGQTGQWGTVNRSGLENTNIRTAETSTERRETQSHTTQLTQMYHLFQAFHLGTNRALFFMEPRPHIRQSEATFINGLRALEGLQEIFLTVVRPKEMGDFCVGVILETAHLTKEPVYTFEEKDDLFTDFRLLATAQNKDDSWGQTDWTSEPISLTKPYYPPAGYDIIGQSTTVLRSQRVYSGPAVTFTPGILSVDGSVTWRFWETGWQNDDHYEDGFLDVDVVVRLRNQQPQLKEYVRKLFLSAHTLCCTPGSEPMHMKHDHSIPYVTDIKRTEFYRGFATPEALQQSRLLADSIRKEMIRSMTSLKRQEYGAQSYEASDAFLTRVADVLRAHRITREFFRPVAQSTVIAKETKEHIDLALGSTSLGDVLSMDASILSGKMGISYQQALDLKEQTLRTIGEKAQRHAGVVRRAEVSNQTSRKTRREQPSKGKEQGE